MHLFDEFKGLAMDGDSFRAATVVERKGGADDCCAVRLINAILIAPINWLRLSEICFEYLERGYGVSAGKIGIWSG